MSQHVEFVRFRVSGGQVPAFLAARQRAIAAVKQAHPLLASVPILARHGDGSWTDVWIYRTEQAARHAAETADGIPEFVAMAQLLEDVDITQAAMVGEEHSTRETQA